MNIVINPTRQSFTLLKSFAYTIITKRGVRRGQPKIFRTKLPKYRTETYGLPPLTSLLTSPKPLGITLQQAIQIRLEKLEIYKKYLPTDSNTNYIEALFNKQSNDIDDVLKIIDANLNTLNSFYTAISFEVLNDLIEANLCDPMTILVSPEFKRLCKKTIFKVRFFESDDLLKLIKCLSNLSISENTLIVQAALQMTRHHINDFNYDELLSLRDSLNKFEEKIEAPKSLLVALKNITPKALERQIKLKLVAPEMLEQLKIEGK